MSRQVDDSGGQVFTASTDDALAWFAWVNARNDDGLTRERLDLPDGERILVRGWPEDARWRRRVSVILSDSVPNLVGRIGLPWPVDGPLNVLEVHTPLLEGYAGFYDPKSDEITISENLDDVTIIHEASHAWFNSRLFTDRWINEGLAEEYASRVLASETRGNVDPAPIKRPAKAAFALGALAAAGADPRRDERCPRAVRVRRGVDGDPRASSTRPARTGCGACSAPPTDRTRSPIRATATPEHNDAAERLAPLPRPRPGAGWRIGAPTCSQTWVLPAAAAAQLADREAARADYARLVGASDGWAAPAVVRLALDGWRFDEAEARIAATRPAIVGQRAATDGAGDGERARAVPTDLETSYESAGTEAALSATAALAANTQASPRLGHRRRAAAVDAPRDWVTTLGLGGKNPDADAAAARSAWEAGDLADGERPIRARRGRRSASRPRPGAAARSSSAAGSRWSWSSCSCC